MGAIPLNTIVKTKRLYRLDAAVAKAPTERRTLNVEAHQVCLGARRGPGARPRLLHEETRVEDLHRPVDGRLALDRATGAGRRDASRPVHAAPQEGVLGRARDLPGQRRKPRPHRNLVGSRPLARDLSAKHDKYLYGK